MKTLFLSLAVVLLSLVSCRPAPITTTTVPTRPASGPATPVAQSVNAVPLKLAAGARPGTFHLVIEDRIRGTREPAVPAVVSIEFAGRRLGEVEVWDEKPFNVAVDLEPGTYGLWVSPANRERYRRLQAGEVHIGPDGSTFCRFPISNPIELVREMSGLSPGGPTPPLVEAKRPTLTWDPVAGAVEYRVSWGYFGWPDTSTLVGFQQLAITARPQFTFRSDLQSGRLCLWHVTALDKNNHALASGNARFLTHGADPHATAKPAEARPGTLPAGSGYLGIVPGATQIQGPGAYRLLPGILVQEIVPGSPASRSDLRPGDVIYELDGQSIGADDPAHFAGRISQLPPAKPITLTIRRGEGPEPKEQHTFRITVGARPASSGGQAFNVGRELFERHPATKPAADETRAGENARGFNGF